MYAKNVACINYPICLNTRMHMRHMHNVCVFACRVIRQSMVNSKEITDVLARVSRRLPK